MTIEQLKKMPLNKIADEVAFVDADDLSIIEKYVLSFSSRVALVMDRVYKETDIMSAPASSKRHLSIPTGLLRHSLGVTLRFLDILYYNGFYNHYDKTDIFLTGLLHDVGKAGQVIEILKPLPEIKQGEESKVRESGDPYNLHLSLLYVKNEDDEKYHYSEDIVKMSVPMRGLFYIASRLNDLWKPSIDCWQAIGYHDGMYVPEGYWVSHGETPLLLALHQADMWQSRVEKEWSNGYDRK